MQKLFEINKNNNLIIKEIKEISVHSNEIKFSLMFHHESSMLLLIVKLKFKIY